MTRMAWGSVCSAHKDKVDGCPRCESGFWYDADALDAAVMDYREGRVKPWSEIRNKLGQEQQT